MISSPHLLAEPCQICGSREADILYRQHFAGFSTDSLLKRYNVAACRRCGFLFADDLPPAEDFARYYGAMSKYEFPESAGRQTPFDLARFESALAVCRPHLPAKDRPIADLGCATGGLLAALKAEGFTNLLGVDPSPACIAAMERLYGIRGLVGSFETLSLPDASCDFLFLTGVLEHLRNPREVLSRLVRLLRPGGGIYVNVPDASRFIEFDDAPFQQFSTEHIGFFTPASLRNIGAAAGLKEIVSVREDLGHSRTTVFPCAGAVFQRDGSPGGLIPDESGPRQLAAYVEKSRERQEIVARDLQALARSQEPIIVWGAGTHTQHLIEDARLGELNIVAFVDNNVCYHDKTMIGRPIVPPTFLADRTERVLVSSRVFEVEIAEQLRREHPRLQPILLYRVAPAEAALA